MMSETNQTTTTKRTFYSLALVAVLAVLIFASVNLYLSMQQQAAQLTHSVAPNEAIIEPPVPEKQIVENKDESNSLPEYTKMEAPQAAEPNVSIDVPAIIIPPLDESDIKIKQVLTEFYTPQLLNLIVNDDIVRRVVVFVDNLAQGKLAQKHTPFIKPLEPFTAIEEDILTISPQSYQRYDPYVDLFVQIPPKQAVALYQQYSVLFDEAYQEIGYPDKSFTGTMREAIDLILATPVVTGNVPLIAQSVTYKFAYSEWEQLPAAQKQLLRMGPRNLKKLKAALKLIKQELPPEQQVEQ
ncbi:hypothetical protein B1199_08665 [Pseudoalteromonas ulvae]|uniref:DUF3014 domain-containing protein n=2 Tax=Pseudoalteromonas ulvae TaxID=107327 RepID=A0A244CS05_PSEDV|nr:hypothetical protein B1199_08665 [Pseudoalteromonas ulvae]